MLFSESDLNHEVQSSYGYLQYILKRSSNCFIFILMQIINNISALGPFLLSLKTSGIRPGDLRSSSIWLFIRLWRGIDTKAKTHGKAGSP